MISVGDVLEGYDGLITYGVNIRKQLIDYIYRLTKNMSLDDSNLSKKNLLRVKFIVSIHDEILKSIEEEKKKFVSSKNNLERHFYINVDYASLYSDIDHFQNLICEHEATIGCINAYKQIYDIKEDVVYDNKEILIVEYFLDTYEEEIAAKLAKLLKKRKER